MKDITKLPSTDFKWESGVLYQKIKVIQHKKNTQHDVGIHTVWEVVKADGNTVTDNEN